MKKKRHDGAFARYLLAYLRGPGPNDQESEEFWQSLQFALFTELRRQALLNLPTRYLGIEGPDTWIVPSKGQAALHELTSECYIDLFCENQKGNRKIDRFFEILQEQLDRFPDREPAIDRVVVVYIRHFVYDRRRAYDPLGYQVFQIMKDAIRDLVARRELTIQSGSEKIRNDTMLAFQPSRPLGLSASEDLLSDFAATLCHDLMPDLITAKGAGRTRVKKGLRQALRGLRDQGIQVFRFGDLITPLKQQVRGLIGALYSDEDDDGRPPGPDGEDFRITSPRLEIEDKDSFLRLAECVGRTLENCDDKPKTCDYLETLWIYLRDYAVDPSRERRPVASQVAKLLKIPRRRFSELYEKLGGFVDLCYDRLSKPLTEQQLAYGKG